MGANHLLGHHDDRLDGESTVAVIEEVLQRGTQQIDDKDVVKAFLAEVVDIRYPGCRRALVNSVSRILGSRCEAYGSRRGSCKYDIHLLIGVHRSFEVPG
jgi:hypothetical protein